MESISSMKIIAGASFLALLNISGTREAPTPTKISINSEPLMLKKGTSAGRRLGQQGLPDTRPGLPAGASWATGHHAV